MIQATRQEARADLAGLSHLGDDGSSEIVGPSGTLSFSSNGDVWPCGLEDIKSKLSDDREIFGGVILPCFCAILVECHVEHPVQTVFDGPVGRTA